MRFFIVSLLLLVINILACDLEKIPDNMNNGSDTTYLLTAVNWDADQDGIIEEDYPLTVQLSSPNNPSATLSNIEIQFKVTKGNGTVAGTSLAKVLSDNQGKASVDWRLGDKLFNEQTVEATVPLSSAGTNALTFTLTPTYFKDSRDGTVYRTVMFNDDIWMAENLKFSAVGECFSGSINNCNTYGRLYSWSEATGLTNGSFPLLPYQGVCPNGWRMAEQADFEAVELLVDANSVYMFMCCPELWDNTTINTSFITNSTGLGFKPGGYKFINDFYGLGQICIFLTASQGSNGGYITYHMRTDDGILHFVVTESQYNSKHSCRCIKVD